MIVNSFADQLNNTIDISVRNQNSLIDNISNDLNKKEVDQISSRKELSDLNESVAQLNEAYNSLDTELKAL